MELYIIFSRIVLDKNAEIKVYIGYNIQWKMYVNIQNIIK